MASLLLVLQAGLGLVAALGLLGFARLNNAVGAMLVPEALAIGGPLLLLLLAVGVARAWRLATPLVLAYEAVTLLGTAVSLLASQGAALSLTVGLTGLALPIATAVLTLRPQPTVSLRRGVTAGLLFLTGVIHLALVLEHTPPLRGLFAIDGALFVALAALSLTRRTGWRLPSAALLVATILAYLAITVTGHEPVEDLGIATKLVELTALGLIVWPSASLSARRAGLAATATLLAIGTSGAIAWAAVLRPDASGQSHAGKVLQTAPPPTDAQRNAAEQLVADTRASIARYADVTSAVADGYTPRTAERAPTVHYLNPAYQRDGATLDPRRPEGLVYANTPRGPVLLGAMYMLPKANVRGPDVGGSIAEWHSHANVCFLLPTFAPDGLVSPFGTCPVGSINAPTPAMLHVWTAEGIPGGPFADLSPRAVAQLTR
jgi:hypothetical protein